MIRTYTNSLKHLALLIFAMLAISQSTLGRENQKEISIKNKPWELDVKKGEKKELIAKRNQFAKHFENADGTFSMFTSPSSQHYKVGNEWKDINLAIKPSNNSNFPFVNDENSFNTYYPSNPVTSKVATRLQEGEMLESIEEVYISDANDNKVFNFQSGNTPSTQVKDNSIEYLNLFSNATVRYAQQNDGRKFDFILHNNQFLNGLASTAKYFVIKEKIILPNGWTIKETTNGIDMYAGSMCVANLPIPLAFETESKNKKYTIDEDLMTEGKLSYTKSGNEVTLLTQFPIEWLSKADRQYPVNLDPVVNYYPANVVNATGYQTSATSKLSGYIRITNTNTNLGWASFDISTLPSGATIASGNYWGYHYTTVGDKFANIIGLQAVLPIPATTTGAMLNAQIIAGPNYNNNYQFGSATLNTWRVGAINGTGLANIAGDVAQGATGLGFRYASGLTTFQYQYGYNAASAANRPYLELNYSTAPCTGQPVTGTATSSLSMACGIPFQLNLTGYSTGGGMTFQWQSSPAGLNTWTNLGGAQISPSYTLTQSVATDYRCIITCTNSMLSATSNVVSVGQNPPTNCYCTPVAGGTTYWIQGFSTTGGLINITNTASGLGTTNVGYSNFTGIHTASQIAGGTINFTGVGNGTSTFGWGIYVDWNQDGDFTDPGETMFTTPSYINTVTGSFTVPMTALPGTTRMRVYNDFLSSTAATGPCGPFASTNGSEAEDYTFIVGGNCTVANAGTASPASTSICEGSTATLTTNAIPYIGASLQWKVSTTNGGPYVNVVGGSGATTASYTIPNNLTGGTYYYIVEQTCANCGPCSAISNQIIVNVNSTPAPTGTSSTQCLPGIPLASVSSNAGALGSGQYTWYSASTGGTILQSPPFGPLASYYFNDFSSPIFVNSSIYGNASIVSNQLQLTPNALSQAGAILVNASGYNSNQLQVDFDATNGPAGLADGFSYSFAPDGSPTLATPTGAERGTGSKLKISFDTYGGGIGASGVYILYNNSVAEPGQAIGVNGVLAYSNDISWVNTTNTHFTISINAAGQVSVLIGGLPILTNVQLPADFLNSNKSTWAHHIKARSGGIAGQFIIDNLAIQLNQNAAGYTTYQSILNSSTNFYVSEMGTNGCPSTRTLVTATVGSPVITASASSNNFCPGSTITLTGNGAGPGGTYSWSGGVTDGVPFQVNATSIYTVTGTSAGLCTNTATIQINTNPVLTGTGTATPSSMCLGQSTVISSSATPLCLGNINGFTGIYAPVNWTISQDNSNGLVNTGGAPSNIILTSGTNQNVNGFGGTTSYRIAVGCSGTVSLNWSFSTSDIAFSDRPRYQINSGASTDMPGFNIFGGTSQSGTASIPVNQGDTLYLQAWTLDNDQFAGTITFSNFSAPSAPLTGTVTIWDAPTGGTNLGSSPQTVTPATSGIVNYYAEYTTNLNGCVNLTRTPIPVAVNALPSVTASATPAAICIGSSSVLSGGGANTYVWNGPNANPYTISPTTATTYTVTGTDGNGCTNTTSITVNVNPLPVMTSLTSTPSPICANGSSVLAVTPGITGAATYCSSNFTNVTYEFLTNVNFGGINNTSGANTGGPVNYTAQTANVVAGVSSTLSVTMDPDANDYIYAWIDWNQNGTLNDAGEQYILASNSNVAGPHTLSITPPLTALNGTTRMRVMVDWNNAVPNPCRSATYGEAEDYTVSVTGGVAPAPGFTSIAWSPATFLNATNTASVTASTVTATTTYTVQGTDANGCTITSSVTLTVSPAPTGNTFATPIVSTLPLSTTGNNIATNCWTSDYTGANAQLSPDVFYQFVMPNCNDSLVLSTCGSPFDTYLHLLDNAGTQLASSDDFCGAASQINLTGLTPGATYYAVVEGFGSNTGTYNLNINSYQSSALVPASLSASPVNPVCENITVTLTAAGAGAGGSYSYTGPATVTGGQFTATLASAGTYTVQATTAAGCIATATITVNVNAAPAVTATPATQTLCENASATVTGGGATSYVWSGGISDATPFTVTSSATYTVTGTDGNGCSNTATAVVNMNAAPLVTAGATPTTTCNNTVVTPTGNGASTYTWSGGLTDNTPFVATATATYTVTGTDGIGCSATSSVTVTVTPASGTIAPATSNQSQSHNDDFNVNYSDASCNLIATVDDVAGGNILGLTTATVNVEATAGIHNGQPFVRRWYQITPTSNGSADVILYINQADFNDYNAAVTAPYLPLPTSGNNADPNIANIRITKNSDAGLGNSPVVITPTVNWNGTYWELSFNTPSFSQFRVHSVNPGNIPLPATVTNFSGRKMSTSDMLEWTTASEQNNAYFNLQHGTDGINFTTIAKVASQAINGNSSSILNYSFENTKPQLGHNYYRLQQVDIDNHSTMNAKVVDIIWGTNGSTVSIYPNPTQDVLNIDLYTSKVQNTTVKVLDMSGRIVKQIQGRSEAGMNKLSISLGEIASGVYTVQVFENDNLTHVSKVKKND